MCDLPRRQPEGYAVETIALQITSDPSMAQAVIQSITLPNPPAERLNTLKLNELLQSLREYAWRAYRTLAARETNEVIASYADPAYARVQIVVISDGNVIGRVNGAQQVFDRYGNMTYHGTTDIIMP